MFRAMFASRTVLKLVLPLALLSLATVNSACGGSKQGTKYATVAPGDMPVGGDWTGVYYSQTYGYLHIIKEGDTISGKWRTTAGDTWGEMSGKATGDLYKFEWKEHKIGMVGPSATSSGRGYFKYTIPKEGEAHELTGEWGLGMDEAGQTWTAVKQKNMRPDPNSVMPDEIEGRHNVGSGWDEGSGTPPPSDSGGGEETDPGALE